MDAKQILSKKANGDNKTVAKKLGVSEETIRYTLRTPKSKKYNKVIDAFAEIVIERDSILSRFDELMAKKLPGDIKIIATILNVEYPNADRILRRKNAKLNKKALEVLAKIVDDREKTIIEAKQMQYEVINN